MALSRERKVFIGVFGAALVVLGVDRGLLGPSKAAAAPSPIGPEVSQLPVEAPAPVQTGGIGQTISVFAERLQKLGSGSTDPLGGGDAFSVPAAWLAVEAQPERSTTPQVAAGPPTQRVTSVMPTKSGGIAIIDGQTYRQGEQVGAFVLEAVEPRSIVLRRGESLYRVALAE